MIKILYIYLTNNIVTFEETFTLETEYYNYYGQYLYSDFETSDETFAISLLGVGASYFLTNSGIGALYVTGTIGRAQYGCLSNSDINDAYADFEGGGVYFGAGIELLSGLSIEAGILSGTIENTEEYSDYEFDYTSVMVSANLLFY